MAVLDIVKYGDPILRKVCDPVTDFSNLKTFIEDMFDTMYEAEGVGLAANQVGKDMNLFVVDVSHTEEADEPFIAINGKIIDGQGECAFEEGCLSIPDVTFEVIRPEIIRFKYQTPDQKWHKKKFNGLFARAIQHEMDHLAGRMIVDHINDLARIPYKKHLKTLEKEAKKRAKSLVI